MKLHELYPAAGATKEVKRIGRGHGSGHGKTAGKGHKGQWARSGGGVRPGFEGGQTSEYTVVNVADLEARFENGAVIDTDALIDAGLVTKVLDGVKVLGNGEVTKSFTVKAAKFSESAKTKIESAGGKAEVE